MHVRFSTRILRQVSQCSHPHQTQRIPSNIASIPAFMYNPLSIQRLMSLFRDNKNPHSKPVIHPPTCPPFQPTRPLFRRPLHRTITYIQSNRTNAHKRTMPCNVIRTAETISYTPHSMNLTLCQIPTHREKRREREKEENETMPCHRTKRLARNFQCLCLTHDKTPESSSCRSAAKDI